MSDYAVIQARFEPIDKETLVQALTTQGRMTHADACRVARRAHGILWEHFSKDDAIAVCKQLTAEGFGVRTIHRDELPELSEPRTIRWFELSKERLQIPEGIRGDTVPMEWSSVFVISVGQIAALDKKLVREQVGPKSLFERNTAVFSDEGPQYRIQGKLIDVVDVIGVDATGRMRYLRLPSNELAFSRIMGVGTELSRFERFLVIVEFLVAHATEAIVSPETRKILVSREPHSQLVEGDGIHRVQEESLQTYNRWLLSQAMIKEEKLDDSPSD